MAAANFKVDNLTAFIDWNKVQATGATEDVFCIPDLDKKWSAFGWNVISVNGHDIEKILEALDEAASVRGKPSVIILDTIKGKSFSFAEGNPAYHNGMFTEEVYRQGLKELDAIKAGM
jgi:transketolase